MDFEQWLENESKKTEKKERPPALVGIGIFCGVLSIVFTIATYPFILPGFRKVCLPYVPATVKQVENVVEALKGRSGNLIDLGSGDGRVVLEAAKNGFTSVGVELNLWLVIYSRLCSYALGLQKKTKFYKTDLWNFDLKPYRNVVIFGVDSMMRQLESKFDRELEKGTQVVACRFPLPGKTPINTIGDGVDKVWVYKV